MADQPAAGGIPPRLITIYQIMLVVLLWNSAYKGVRVLNTLYALELGATPLHIGLLLATYGVFPLLLAVMAGRIADRYGSRVPIIAGSKFAQVTDDFVAFPADGSNHFGGEYKDDMQQSIPASQLELLRERGYLPQ